MQPLTKPAAVELANWVSHQQVIHGYIDTFTYTYAVLYGSVRKDMYEICYVEKAIRPTGSNDSSATNNKVHLIFV